MNSFSDIDIDINDMISLGATRDEVLAKYPFLTEQELDMYFGRELDYGNTDGDIVEYDDLINEPRLDDGEEYY